MMTDHGSEATFVVGRFGRIEDVDDVACALVGYPRSELLALHGTDLVLPEDRNAVAVSIDRMRYGNLDRRQGRLVRKDGSLVRVDVTARPLPQDRIALVVRALADDLG